MNSVIERRTTSVNLDISGIPAHLADPLHDILGVFARAWQAGDCEAIIQLLAPDIIWVNSYGEFSRGSEEVAEHLQSTLCSPFDPDITPGEAKRLHAVASCAIGEEAVSVQLFAAGEVRQRTVSLVCERASDRWYIRHCMIGSSL